MLKQNMLNLEEIREYYEAGDSLRDLAEHYNCSVITIHKAIKQSGARIRYVGRPRSHDLPVEEICRRYREGVPSTFLARTYDCSAATILRLLRRNNVPIKRPGENKVAIIYWNEDRANELMQDYLSMGTLERVGKTHGISKQRVHQILKRNNLL